METIYWIQRLGLLNTLGWILFAISIIAFIIFGIISIQTHEYRDDDDSDAMWYKVAFRGLKTTLGVFFISLLIGIFVPTTNELYAIYGIGGTIDYIKSNDTAKQLPDKVINALDAWVDKQVNDNNQDK